MDLYFERHDGDAATIEDFLKVFEDVSGRDLSQFALWYHQAGTPNLSVSASHDPAAGELVVEIEQSVPPTPSESRKRLMHIPLAFGLVGPDGNDMAYSGVEGATVEDGVIHLKQTPPRGALLRHRRRPALSLNRGFSAPITLVDASAGGPLLPRPP
jgi:aminopeptidase N